MNKKGHELEYTTRNRKNSKYQVYAFEGPLALKEDMTRLTGKSYEYIK